MRRGVDGPETGHGEGGTVSPERVVEAACKAVLASGSPGGVLRELLPARGDLAFDVAIRLTGDAPAPVRSAATEFLGLSENEAVVQRLVDLLDDHDTQVRIHARNALVEIGSQAVVDTLLDRLEDLRSDPGTARIEVLGALLEGQGPLFVARHRLRVPELVGALSGFLGHRDPAVRAEAARAVGKAGPLAAPVLPLLAEALADSDTRVRANVIAALSAMDTEDARLLLEEIALPRIADDLRSPDPVERSAAASAACHLGAPALPVLVSALKNADDALRFGIMLSLRRLEAAGHGVVRALIAFVRDEDPRVRRNIMYTLQDIATPEALEVVRMTRLDAMEDPLERVLRTMETWARRDAPVRNGPYRLTYGDFSRADGEPLLEPADIAAERYVEEIMVHFGDRLAEHACWEVVLEQDVDLDGLLLHPVSITGVVSDREAGLRTPMEVVFERATGGMVLVIGGE